MDFVVHTTTMESELRDLEFPGMHKASTEQCFTVEIHQVRKRQEKGMNT